MISLLDSVDTYLVDVWLAYYDRPHRHWMWRFLQQGFKHVEVWTLDRGAWARIDPCLEFMLAGVYTQPPWEVLPYAKFQHVQRLVPIGKVREIFMVGPVTCVELAKAMLGLRAPFVRTPFQLYNYIRGAE